MAFQAMEEVQDPLEQLGEDVVTMKAKTNLARKRKGLATLEEQMREKWNRATSPSLKLREVLAACLWIEHIGPAVGVPVVEHLFPCFSNVSAHSSAFVLESNAAKVRATLVAAQERLAALSKVVDFQKLEVVGEHSQDLALQLMLWRQTLTRIDPTWHEHTTLAEDTLAQLVKWQRLWHTAQKSMACSIKDAARLHLACSRLEKSSELMWMASMTLSYSAEFEAQWLEQEAAALTCAIVLESERLGHVPATLKRKESERGLATPGVAPRKKGRDAFALFCSTINALASTRVQFAKPAVQDEKGMQREIEWASRTALNGSSELRLKSEVESQVESQRLMECLKAQKESLRAAKDYEVAKVEKQARADIQRAAEVYRKQAQEYILAAAAAERDRFEAEKAQAEVAARRRYAQVEREAREAAEACGICLNKPRNVVILPCSHGSYCSDCLARHGRINNTCPTCRTPIANLVRYIQ